MADVALCCLPHKVSMQFVPELLRAGVKVVDFSADYRIKDVTVYEKYYSVVHTDAVHLDEAVYGLPELFREKIQKARLIAIPAASRPARRWPGPLLKAGLIDPASVIVNSVTGASGAGKTRRSSSTSPT
jgi:N-acetyl-gamma-glutamyl-phosphate reductase